MMTQDYVVEQCERPRDGVYGYVGDVAITDEVIERLNRSAESGHPGVVARPVGHPLQIADRPAVLVQFRADQEKLRRLDAKAKEHGVTRSALLRDALDRELMAV